MKREEVKTLDEKDVEITDEQANEAAGGVNIRPRIQKIETDTCFLCGKRTMVDEMTYTTIKNQRRLVCFKCMGLR